MHKPGMLPATSPAHSLARLSTSSAFIVTLCVLPSAS